MTLRTQQQIPGGQGWEINKLQAKKETPTPEAPAEAQAEAAPPSQLATEDQFQGHPQAQAEGEPVVNAALFPDKVAEEQAENSPEMELQALEQAEQAEQPENAEATEGEVASDGPESMEEAEQARQEQEPRSFDDSMEGLLAMIQEKDYNVQDPQVMQAMQDLIREMEDQNIKAMLDMIQQSLDRAAEMREQQERDYLQKELPLKMAVEAQIQNMHLQAENAEQAALENAVEQLDGQVQGLSQALMTQAAATGDQRGAEVYLAAAKALTQALKSQISSP